MLKFACFPDDKNNGAPDLRGAYIIGIDGVPVRGELHIDGNMIVCESRTQEALGIAVLWPVKNFGKLQLQTTRLPTREQPYNLHVELVRQRLMRILAKREEWGLFDYPGIEPISAKIEQARVFFIRALQAAEDPRAAARLADEALSISVTASEDLCRFHADVFVERRRQAGGFARDFLGVCVPPETPADAMNKGFKNTFDYLQIPLIWREIQTDERSFDYDAVDRWIKQAGKAKLSVRGGPVLNFGIQYVPDWMYAWEDDYEAVVGYAREHVRRAVSRYAGKINSWIVASGLHADNVFSFSFEQVIDLTRQAANIARQVAPKAQLILDITQPWGEYFARNQRSTPPLLYAEMAVQSGINFDAFGVQFLFGMDAEGFHPRDLFQVSSLIDRLANLGRPLHITAAAIPSDESAVPVADRPWSERIQAEWLTDFCRTALSKPYVESVCLQTLTDAVCRGVPSGGVLRKDMTAKPIFEKLAAVRKELAHGNVT